MKFSLVGSDKQIIIVKAKVNGKGPFDFAVDTGASVTALSKQLAKDLEIQRRRNACSNPLFRVFGRRDSRIKNKV